MRIVDWDLETERFGPSNLAPEPICLSFADSDGQQLVVASCESHFDDVVEEMLRYDLIVNTNIAFDMAVILAHRPKLSSLIFKAYREDRVSCLVVRDKLLVLADTGDLKFATLPDGTKKPLLYAQSEMEKRRLGIDRTDEKAQDDAWRANYGTLKGIPASEYPPDAHRYSLEDSVNGLRIFYSQEEEAQRSGLAPLASQFLTTKAGLALYLSSCWGFPVDAAEVERLYAGLSARFHERAIVRDEDGTERMAYFHLLQSGILRPGEPPRPHKRHLQLAEQTIGRSVEDWTPYVPVLTAAGVAFTKEVKSSKDTMKLREHIEKVCADLGIEPVLTETGMVSYGEEMLLEIAGLDPVVDELIDRNEIEKLVTTELPRMRAGRVHPKYDPLKSTGRTSSYGNSKKDKEIAYPAVNIQNIDPRVRHAYVASPGNVLCSVDYNFIELVSVAQRCLDLFGQSILADKINAGCDPHAYLGASIMARVEPGFGTGSPDGNYEKFLKLKTENRKHYDHFRGLAKPTGLGFPGGLGAARFVGYAKSTFKVDLVKLTGSMDAALQMAKDLKQQWRETFPEMDAWFRFVTSQCVDSDWSGPDDTRYQYTTPFGMIRRNCRYTEATNGGALQSPTAEGAKIAIYNLAEAMFDDTLRSPVLGCHMPAFIHDEVIVEMPHDELMHERSFEVARIMIDGMKQVMTKVKVGAEPACMFRWSKKAEKVLGPDGRLQVWTPKS